MVQPFISIKITRLLSYTPGDFLPWIAPHDNSVPRENTLLFEWFEQDYQLLGSDWLAAGVLLISNSIQLVNDKKYVNGKQGSVDLANKKQDYFDQRYVWLAEWGSH